MIVITEAIFEELYEIFDENFEDNVKIDKETLKNNIYNEKYRIYILTLKNEIIGAFIYNPIISLKSENIVFIEYIFIKKEYQSMGYGKRFIKECLEKLNSVYKSIYLDCVETLISYYEKLMFKKIGYKYKNGVKLFLMGNIEYNNFKKYWMVNL
jgi:predicted GNAT family N-acyltransferase